ncbi:hypothetical protein R3P38DRAFT_2808485 [Favolaschia claudopus]|uniref:Uncharacterized protein n=1 Tax=Favolaschia claudopus TaxID=2862362 RepID=A0AAV9ZFP2_9AGAR
MYLSGFSVLVILAAALYGVRTAAPNSKWSPGGNGRHIFDFEQFEGSPPLRVNGGAVRQIEYRRHRAAVGVVESEMNRELKVFDFDAFRGPTSTARQRRRRSANPAPGATEDIESMLGKRQTSTARERRRQTAGRAPGATDDIQWMPDLDGAREAYLSVNSSLKSNECHQCYLGVLVNFAGRFRRRENGGAERQNKHRGCWAASNIVWAQVDLPCWRSAPRENGKAKRKIGQKWMNKFTIFDSDHFEASLLLRGNGGAVRRIEPRRQQRALNKCWVCVSLDRPLLRENGGAVRRIEPQGQQRALNEWWGRPPWRENGGVGDQIKAPRRCPASNMLLIAFDEFWGQTSTVVPNEESCPESNNRHKKHAGNAARKAKQKHRKH